ncbi:hypothetical protein [Stenotrophomonas sp.]|uniref:hypothetical protein n=1 Tax=Stenotrophomonas sp. TaxID=69392 RepID=UPI0028A6A6B1|nr:hypothetical protein [Stenotrophomonas sp.]
MNDSTAFDQVLPLLQAAQRETIDGLRHSPGTPALLERKRQLDRAVACLQLCAQHAIDGRARVTVLPWTGDAFGSFGVFELDEEGQTVHGQVVQLDDVRLELLPGDLLVQGTGRLPEEPAE